MNIKNTLARLVLKYISTDAESYTEFVDTFGDYFGIKTRNAYSSWVFSCLDIMGKYFAKAQFRLYIKRGDGTKEEYVKDHPFTSMLSNPNGVQTLWELLYMLGPSLGLYGNYYLRKLRTPLGVWKASVLMPPASVMVTLDDIDGLPKYKYFNGKGQVDIPRRDIVHVRYPNPESTYYGKPIIAYFMDQIEVERYQLKYQKEFYKKGGWMGNVFTTDGELSNLSFKRAQDQLNENFGDSVSGAFRAAIFDSGLKPVKGAFSMKDMDIKNQRELNRTEVLGGFQVPEALLGIASNANKASLEAVIYAFTTGVVDPLLALVDQILTIQVRSEFGPRFEVIHDSLAPRDVEGRLNYYKTMQEGGNMTINEVRQEEGYDKFTHELADVPIINVGGTIVRLDKPIEGQTNSPNGDRASSSQSGEVQSGDGKEKPGKEKPKK